MERAPGGAIRYIGDEWYLDFHAGQLDPRIAAIVQSSGLPFLDFYFSSFKMDTDDFARYESVSLAQWCRERGIDRDPVLYEMLHAVGTLITTINDPAEISIGDIFRYFAEVINPRFKRAIARWPSGFVVGGIQRWVDSVAERFRNLGGELRLNTRVQEILIADGRVRGIAVQAADGSTALYYAAIGILAGEFDCTLASLR